MAIPYLFPRAWIQYDLKSVLNELLEAKSALLSLSSVPYQRSWADALQEIQLKREVAGTSRIEGAEFTESELEVALTESAEQLHTRSQKQARAAVETYRWIARLSDDVPISVDLIKEVHRRIVTGADDDHCPPGGLREAGQNVTFGAPVHRGAEGGETCFAAVEGLANALRSEYRGHDLLVQALAAHYHLAAIHPFLDGNGRTARAVEALMLQRSGLRDALFIAMSNYYYDEKTGYLKSLAAVREVEHDLSAFLRFGLKGIALQCRRLFSEIREHLARAVFRNLMHDLFGRLQTPKKRVIAKRQLRILNELLSHGELPLEELERRLFQEYSNLKSPFTALVRDLHALIHLGAIKALKDSQDEYRISVILDWPSKITERAFFEKLRSLPRAKSTSFLLP